MEKYIYGVNNYSGVAVDGLKDSVYDIKKYYKEDLEIIEEDSKLVDGSKTLINLERVADINTRVYDYADKLIKDGYLPISFAGDHSIAIGTIGATANNYDNLAIIWVDAHADINTEDTSPSGNIHGMPLSFLLGYGCEKLSKIGAWSPKIKAENITYLGLRSVDPGERKIIEDLGIRAYYYDEISQRGLEEVLKEVLEKNKDLENIHLSFDFDSMDPKVYDAVSTPVPRGFYKEDVLNIFRSIRETGKVRAIDLVEYNRSKAKNQDSFNFTIELLDFINN